MNHASQHTHAPGQLLRILRDHPKRWLIPAIAATALAGVYALLRPATWEASQALIVRNEATAGQDVPGRFVQPDDMKTVQETILELVKTGGVLSAALAEVGPPAEARDSGEAWPNPSDVADLRDAVKLAPPKGAEFGKTEIFYLKVRAGDRGRAVTLANAISGQLQAAVEKVRDAKARSVICELEKTVGLAEADLSQSTGRLSDIERRVGSDLAELRLLYESNSGESVLRRAATEIRAELRQVRSAIQSNGQLLALLKQAQTEPERLVASPNSLLDSQPALKKLKDGLVEAQLNTAQLQGRMSAEHPLVVAAKQSQAEIRNRVHDELANAIRAIEVDLRLGREKAATLDEQLAGVNARLDKLAAQRAPYANQVAETRKRSELLDRAQQRLADARASQASAGAASLISRIDGPDTGTRPISPSRAAIVLVGLVGGLLAGFGVVLLTVDPGRDGSHGPLARGVPEHRQDANTAPSNANGNGRRHSPAPHRDLTVQEALKKLASGRRV
jgi:succinoglycan biosynthesis transport protein ExoP